MALVRGIDISSYQRVTSWSEVASAVGFVIVKATESTGFTSSTWSRYFAAARAAGLLVGSYHFARPEAAVMTQALHYVQALKAAGWKSGRDLPPILDIETTGRLGKLALTTWCLRFCSEVDSRLGLTDPWLRCGVYANADYRATKFDGERVLSGRWLHHAAWPSTYRRTWPPESARPSGAAIWQFTDSGIGLVPGITGSGLDLDVARSADLAALAPDYSPAAARAAPDPYQEDDMQSDELIKLTPGEQARGHYDSDTYTVRSLLVHAAIGGRQIAADILPVLVDVQGDLGKLAKPMNDTDREALAADIASKVDTLRIQISHDLADEATEDK